MPGYFELYKPLRNHVKQYERKESLKICWEISNHLAFNKQLSYSFELPPKVAGHTDIMFFKLFVMHEWELEFLVNEIIVSAEKRMIGNKKSLYKRRDREKVVNDLRRIHDVVPESVNEEMIFLELNRISHQQFPWQTINYKAHVYRHYKIFSQGNISNIILDVFGLSIEKIIKIGFLLFAGFTSNAAMSLTVNSDSQEFNNHDIQRFIQKFSIDIEELKKIIIENRKYDHTLLYRFKNLRASPIIVDSELLCPIPILLFWQITNGLYYSICNSPNFGDYYGESFQNYLLSVITKVNVDNSLTIYPERIYGNPEKRTADIIISDSDAILFIECKTKRMIRKAFENLYDNAPIESELTKIASAFYQLYKTIDEYRNNNYPHIRYDEEKKIYLMVVTLEDWYIGYNPFLYDKLKQKIFDYFIEDNKSVIDVIRLPYFFYSIDEFERAIQVMSSEGIINYCEKFLNENGFDAFREFEYHHPFESETRELLNLPQL